MRSATTLLLCVGCGAALTLAPAAAWAVGPVPVKVFLLAGQSNMAGRAPTSGLPVALQSPQDDVLFYYGSSLTTLRPGSGRDFGPEVTFGRTVADEFPTETFALIKYASGGSDLHTDWDPSGGGQYNAFRSKVTGGLAALVSNSYDPEIVGMLWTQGERDAKTGRSTAQYEVDLNEFIADMRVNYGSDLPFFLSRLSSGQTNIPAAGLTEIRTAQANVAASDAFSYMIDTDGFGLKGDNLHFDAAGQIALGEAFGQSYIDVPEPVTPGDANGNGYVDDTDLAIMLGNWEKDPAVISTWELGNFTEGSLGDTDVDDNDLTVLLGNWTGPPPAGAAVPEPATLSLLALGGLAVMRRRRRAH